MTAEIQKTPEEARKEAWLKELANFIVEANGKTWAVDGAEVEPERPGYKELQYENGDWRLRDSYTGYFRAPGMTTVYYKETPAWVMQYGGHGQTEGYEDRADETFSFLRKALKLVTPELPFRGPEEYVDGDKIYRFRFTGNIEDASWEEDIFEGNQKTFAQEGSAGIVIHKKRENGKPVYPWNR